MQERKVGLFSIGSLEEKLSLILTPLLQASDLEISIYQNYAYPRDITDELVHEIDRHLQRKKIGGVVFDLRIHGWKNSSCLKRSRILSRSLQKVCDDLRVSHSIILSNGDFFLGNALGFLAEKMEAQKVLEGKGPLDLNKFVLEVGGEILLMTKKARQRIAAKKILRDKIISGELSATRPNRLKKTLLTSLKEGFVHSLDLGKLNALRSLLCSVHPGIGFFLLKKIGDWIGKGDPIVKLYSPKGQKTPALQAECQKIFVLRNTPLPHQPVILEKMDLKIHE